MIRNRSDNTGTLCQVLNSTELDPLFCVSVPYILYQGKM